MARLPLLLSIAVAVQAAVMARSADPFDMFRPAIVLRPAERQALDRGTPVLILLPAEGRQLAVFSAIDVDSQDRGDRLNGWVRQIEQLRKNGHVVATGRFSSPIEATDVGAITLDARDLDDLKRCRPGRCNLKLSAAEILELQRVIAASGTTWRNAVQRAFQVIVLRRVTAYVTGGHGALGDHADHAVPRSPSAAFRQIARKTAVLEQIAPDILERAARCPAAFLGSNRGYIYWSRERLGDKTVISATHVVLVEAGGGSSAEMFAVGIQIFATHYLDAALEITGIVRAADARQYLVHSYRAEVDLLDGFWGGLARAAIGSRIKKDGPAALEAARHRLSAIDPPNP